MRKRFQQLNGYILEYCPDHPNAITSSNYQGYVYQHRLMMEKELGRYLVENEEVHHLNGNRADNRPANLIVLQDSYHTRLHNYQRNVFTIPKPGFLQPDTNCKYCGNVLENGQKNYCNSTCELNFNNKIPVNELVYTEHDYCFILRYCENCNNVLSNRQNRFCCKECSDIFVRNGNKSFFIMPDVDQLGRDFAFLPIEHIAMKYDKTIDTIKCWAKQYGIQYSFD